MEPADRFTILDLRERGPGHALIHALFTEPEMLRSRGAGARLLGLSPLTERGKDWYRGLVAEIAVGQMLSKLGQRWVVMHGVPIGRRGSDIDHVVVGKAGVFTVNTKNHSGQKVWVSEHSVLVAGVRSDHVRNSEHEARRTARLLAGVLGWPVQVCPVIAVLDPARLDIKRRPAGVEILEARKVVRWLQKRSSVMSDEQLSQVVAAIGTPSTWQYQPHDHADLDRRLPFAELRTTVEKAKKRRVAWAAAVALTVTGAVLALILQLVG